MVTLLQHQAAEQARWHAFTTDEQMLFQRLLAAHRQPTMVITSPLTMNEGALAERLYAELTELMKPSSTTLDVDHRGIGTPSSDR